MRKLEFQKSMPEYKSHKNVRALEIGKITHILGNSDNPDGETHLHFVKDGFGSIEVSLEYMDKHDPRTGGYYVVYEDGYESWSPGPVFENGYTLIGAEE